MNSILHNANARELQGEGSFQEVVAKTGVRACNVHRKALEVRAVGFAVFMFVVRCASHAAGDDKGPVEVVAQGLQFVDEVCLYVTRPTTALAGELAFAEVFAQVSHVTSPKTSKQDQSLLHKSAFRGK